MRESHRSPDLREEQAGDKMDDALEDDDEGDEDTRRREGKKSSRGIVYSVPARVRCAW